MLLKNFNNVLSRAVFPLLPSKPSSKAGDGKTGGLSFLFIGVRYLCPFFLSFLCGTFIDLIPFDRRKKRSFQMVQDFEWVNDGSVSTFISKYNRRFVMAQNK